MSDPVMADYDVVGGEGDMFFPEETSSMATTDDDDSSSDPESYGEPMGDDPTPPRGGGVNRLASGADDDGSSGSDEDGPRAAAGRARQMAGILIPTNDYTQRELDLLPMTNLLPAVEQWRLLWIALSSGFKVVKGLEGVCDKYLRMTVTAGLMGRNSCRYYEGLLGLLEYAQDRRLLA